MGATKVFIYRNPQLSRCPNCSALATLHRSRARNMWEQVVRKTTFLKTYRCKECGWRGFRSTVTITKKSLKAVIIYVSLILLTAWLARYFIINYALN